MLVHLNSVVPRAEVDRIVEVLEAAAFQDGRLTAGGRAREAKRNLQLTREADLGAALGQQVVKHLARDRRFQAAALPHSFVPPIFSRYDTGMAYGSHLDSPLMGAARTRTDISVTIFLSDADAYDGGELVIDSDYGTVPFKGAAGDAVAYPSSSVHRVDPVTRGTRFVAVTWLQSLVRCAARRRILYDLAGAIDRLKAAGTSGDAEIDTLNKCRDNLLRMWVER